MAEFKRPYTQRKGDRLVNPGANKEDIACDHALAPFDRLAREMEFKSGIDKLPELVSPATAEKFGVTIGNLNAALEANIPADVVACAESGIRGLQYMHAEATAAGHKPHDADWWECELPGEDGGEPFRIAILRDGLDWQEVKAKRPDLIPYSLHEVAVALRAYLHSPLIAETKKRFPRAQVTKINMPPVNYKAGGDPLPF